MHALDHYAECYVNFSNFPSNGLLGTNVDCNNRQNASICNVGFTVLIKKY